MGGGLTALLLSFGLPAISGTVTVRVIDGPEIGRFPVPDGAGWCVLWNHSVQGFEVADCYENRGGRMVLVRSRQPDFAAGLGHIPGRGRQVSDGEGGYVIEGLDEPVPGNAYVLRPGRASVNHRIVAGETVIPLSAAAPRERVRIELIPETRED